MSAISRASREAERPGSKVDRRILRPGWTALTDDENAGIPALSAAPSQLDAEIDRFCNHAQNEAAP